MKMKEEVLHRAGSLGRVVFLPLLLLAVLLLAACGDGDGVAVQEEAPEAAPTLQWEPQAVKTFHFSWTDVDDATYYNLLEDPDGASGFTAVITNIPQGTQQADHQVPLYFRLNALYILQACNDAGCVNSPELAVSGNLANAVGYFKASNTDGDDFGYALSISGDGSTLAVGAYGEDSSATGINGDQSNDDASNAGAVYVFIRDEDGAWAQQAYIKASNTDAYDYFGYALSISGDGSTLAVGAYGEDSNATGVDGDQGNNDTPYSGAVYVFVRDEDGAWVQEAYIKASNTGGGDMFGYALSISGDGSTLAVGAYLEDSSATGIDGDQSNDDATDSGAVYVFVRDEDGAWAQEAYIKASNTGGEDLFGWALSVSMDGSIIAVGALWEDSSATGIDGDQSNDDAENSGAVYVFVRDGGAWAQEAYIKASNTDAHDYFGHALSISGDGSTLAVGAHKEDSNATGIDGDQNNDDASHAGAVYVFARDGGAWAQQAYVKASNTDGGDEFGYALSISGDGSTLAVGAYGENSNATGVDGDQGNNDTPDSGAVYVFVRDEGGAWAQQAYVKASNTETDDYFGYALSISGDGSTLAVGAYGEDSSATGIDGDQSNNDASGSGAAYLY